MYPQKPRQAPLWQELLQLQPPQSKAWMLMGDFNNILALQEKLGGTQLHNCDTNNFMAFLIMLLLFLCHLLVTCTLGVTIKIILFVYMKGWIELLLTQAGRLRLFPFASLNNLPIHGSDHGPIFISFNPTTHTKKKKIKLEAIWLQHPSFSQSE